MWDVAEIGLIRIEMINIAPLVTKSIRSNGEWVEKYVEEEKLAIPRSAREPQLEDQVGYKNPMKNIMNKRGPYSIQARQ